MTNSQCLESKPTQFRIMSEFTWRGQGRSSVNLV